MRKPFFITPLWVEYHPSLPQGERDTTNSEYCQDIHKIAKSLKKVVSAANKPKAEPSNTTFWIPKLLPTVIAIGTTMQEIGDMTDKGHMNEPNASEQSVNIAAKNFLDFISKNENSLDFIPEKLKLGRMEVPARKEAQTTLKFMKNVTEDISRNADKAASEEVKPSRG